MSLSAPRITDGEPSPVDAWMRQHKERFLTLLAQVFFEQFPGLRGRYEGQFDEVAQKILALIEEDLRRYALRRLVIRWSASRYPDAVSLGEPERDGQQFVIPVFSRLNNERIGNVILSAGGRVLPETTTRQQLREALVRAA